MSVYLASHPEPKNVYFFKSRNNDLKRFIPATVPKLRLKIEVAETIKSAFLCSIFYFFNIVLFLTNFYKYSVF